MTMWQNGVLQALLRGSPPLLLVADPDGVLLNEGVQRGIEEHGYELLTYNDPVHFRVTFELRYRQALESESSDSRLLVRTEQAEAEQLPYDLLELGEVRTVPSWQEATALGAGSTRGIAETKVDESEAQLHHLAEALARLAKIVPSSDTSFTTWLAFACEWAGFQQLGYSIRASLPPPLRTTIAELESQVDHALQEWALSHYASLYNQPTIDGPVMVHHIPRYLARHLRTDAGSKIVLIIVDGLALNQWFV
ncbi:MAG: hypothetical protein M3220_09730, partial [Chloroflexota bacterium]|nr:hypothetical protein [Chloroflexota bacterium]